MVKSFPPNYQLHLERQQQDFVARVKGLPAILSAEDLFANTCHVAEANLRHFYPDWDSARYRAVIAEVLHMQALAQVEQSIVPLMDCTVLEDRSGVLADGRAAGAHIFCTYHLASYRRFYLYLKQAGIDFVLLMSGDTMLRQAEWILEDSRMVSAQQGWGGNLSIIDAESPSGLLQCARALRRGLSVLVLIDGNSGAGGMQNLQPVPFLGRELMARTGVATLSHLTGTPIVPVVCGRDAVQLQMTLHQAIVPGHVPRDTYVRATTQALYDLLAQSVAQNPGQWEGWLYVHNFLRRQAGALAGAGAAYRPELLPQQHIGADVEQFAMLYFGTQAVLLNKTRHRFTVLDSETADAYRAVAAGGQPEWAGARQHSALLRLLEIGALRAA